MKFFLVLLVFLFGAWLWRSGRQKNAINKPPSPLNTPQNMVSCSHCGVHIPQKESVQGRNGVYCCQAHQKQAER
jgi:uncharacterized protein